MALLMLFLEAMNNNQEHNNAVRLCGVANLHANEQKMHVFL